MDADWIFAPFDEPFMRRALLGVTLAGVNCAALGAYIVLRRMASVAGAITHTILPGIVLALMSGVSIYLGAGVAAIVTAIGVGTVTNRRHLREDTATGVMLAFMFSLGILLMARNDSFRDFTDLMIGNVLAINREDILVITGVTGVTSLFLAAFHKELELASYDEDYAANTGVRPALLRNLLLIGIALGTVACVRIVGAMLTTALLVTPAAAGVMLARTVPGVMAWGGGIAISSGIAGLLISYHVEKVPAGAAIVLVCTTFFAAAWLRRFFADHRAPGAFDEDR